MDTRQQISQVEALVRAQQEERREHSLFRAAIKSAAIAYAAGALFGRRGS